jgi:glycosyltransferase involved in cell wall biosynthesis
MRQRLGLDFRYRIAGEGPDKEALRQLALASGIEAQTEFVGWLEPSELPNFYRSGDVFLHPSLFDPFPNAVLEAMATGLTVIGSEAAGSIADRVRHGDNGLIHRVNDVDDLAEQVNHALSSQPRLAEMGHRARATAEAWPVGRAVAAVKKIILG